MDTAHKIGSVIDYTGHELLWDLKGRKPQWAIFRLINLTSNKCVNGKLS